MRGQAVGGGVPRKGKEEGAGAKKKKNVEGGKQFFGLLKSCYSTAN